jgi:hypothetical protein
MGQLFFGILTGAVGVAYIVYGRRQTRLVPVVSGVLLCVYSYFVESWLWLSLLGAVLIAAPFVVDW